MYGETQFLLEVIEIIELSLCHNYSCMLRYPVLSQTLHLLVQAVKIMEYTPALDKPLEMYFFPCRMSFSSSEYAVV